MELDGLITLADLPALAGKDPTPTAQIVIGRLDDNLRDPRYGRFAITQKHVDGWKRNLSETFGGQVSMDFDHSSDRGNGTKAACWITGIDQTGTKNGDHITASVQFTRAGAKAVRSGEYKYTSPTFVENYVDEHGVKHGPALIGGALTNRPVLRKGMPTLSLSKDTFPELDVDAGKRERKRARTQARDLGRVSPKVRKKTATLKGKGKPEFPMPDKLHARLALQFVRRSLKAGNITPADAAKIRARANAMLGKGSGEKTAALDSRAHMADRADLIKLLGLDESADSDAILAATCVTLAGGNGNGDGNAGAGAIAAAAAAQKASKKAKKAAKKKAKTMALDGDGNVLLDAQGLADLMTAANAGQAAATQLSEERFTTAWQKALDEGRAAPAQEEVMRALHRKDPEMAVKTLDSFVKILPTEPAGSGEGPSSEPAPAGMDEERYALHQQAKALAREKVKADPSLDEGAAYALAAVEIADRQFELANPGI